MKIHLAGKKHAAKAGRSRQAPPSGEAHNYEELPIWFDEVWEFSVDASTVSKPPTRWVLFQSGIARTTIRGLPHKLEITNKSMYEVLKPYMDKMKAESELVVKKP